MELKQPDIIDIADLPIIKHNTKKIYNTTDVYNREYDDDVKNLIIRTNITNLLNLYDDCDNNDDERLKIINILKNTIILHGDSLVHMPKFIKQLKYTLNQYGLKYNVCVVYKMLHNITEKKQRDNINFRKISDVVKKYPTISAEDEIIISNRIANMRFSYQLSKKPSVFKEGQIVGARDKEHKWWLSRVLAIHSDVERAGYWYYIRFEGWGSMHDEWIYSDTYRVRLFNSRKHFLKK
jgi:hypothetical protein